MKTPIILSPLPHTWFIDIDGTIAKHNGYLVDGHDTLLPGVKTFFAGIPTEDRIILVSSRKEQYRKDTILFLQKNGIRFDEALFEMPMGERILINDSKSSGLQTALALNPKRNEGLADIVVSIDQTK